MNDISGFNQYSAFLNMKDISVCLENMSKKKDKALKESFPDFLE